MRIENAFIFTETAQFVKRDITLGGQYIIDGTPDDETIDASDLYVIPGLIDTHIHGCMGVDFSRSDMNELRRICQYQAQNGVTSIFPTTVSMPSDVLANSCKLAAEFEAEENEACILGVHLEGPFISEKEKGAQTAKYFSHPNYELIKDITSLSDELIYIVTLAPELNGSLQVIDDLVNDQETEIKVSIGHTAADYFTASEAFKSGATRTTHLFNAMPALTHTSPGVIGAAFDNEDTYVEIVADGVHIHPSLIRASISMFGEDRVIFVSDSFSGTGMPDGVYPFGDEKFNVEYGLARLESNPEILGSVTNLMGCLKNAVLDMEIPLETAVRLSSMNPAMSLGLFDQLGSVTPGKYADLVIVDDDLNIKAVIVRGNMIVNNL